MGGEERVSMVSVLFEPDSMELVQKKNYVNITKCFFYACARVRGILASVNIAAFNLTLVPLDSVDVYVCVRTGV